MDAASTAPAFQRRPAAGGAVTTSTHDVHRACTPSSQRSRETPSMSSLGMVTVAEAASEQVHRDPVFQISDLTVTYGKTTAVKDVGIEIYKNAITALIG